MSRRPRPLPELRVAAAFHRFRESLFFLPGEVARSIAAEGEQVVDAMVQGARGEHPGPDSAGRHGDDGTADRLR